MSSGDYVRYLRALKGGPTPFQIEAATGVSSSIYRQLEQRYRAVGTEEDLRKLAKYFGVAPKELLDRHPWTRKELSAVLVEAAEQNCPIRLYLRTGETFTGKVVWSDLGAALLELEDGQRVVVQRHMVDRWELLLGEKEGDAAQM